VVLTFVAPALSGNGGSTSWKRIGLTGGLRYTLGTFVVCVLDAFWVSDGFLYFFVFIPIVSLSLLGFLLNAFMRKKPGRFLSVLAMLAVFWAISAASVENHSARHC
jgi:hypothetical protein